MGSQRNPQGNGRRITTDTGAVPKRQPLYLIMEKELINIIISLGTVSPAILLDLAIYNNYKYMMRKLSNLVKQKKLTIIHVSDNKRGRPYNFYTFTKEFSKTLEVKSFKLKHISKHFRANLEITSKIIKQSKKSGLEVELISENSLINAPVIKLCTTYVEIIPDNCFTLEKDGKKVLLFSEIDLSHESMRVLQDKVNRYAEAYNDTQAIHSLSEHFNYNFQGFRLLLIVTQQKRLEMMHRFARNKEYSFLYTALFSDVLDDFMGEIWVTNDGKRAVVRRADAI